MILEHIPLGALPFVGPLGAGKQMPQGRQLIMTHDWSLGPSSDRTQCSLDQPPTRFSPANSRSQARVTTCNVRGDCGSKCLSLGGLQDPLAGGPAHVFRQMSLRKRDTMDHPKEDESRMIAIRKTNTQPQIVVGDHALRRAQLRGVNTSAIELKPDYSSSASEAPPSRSYVVPNPTSVRAQAESRTSCAKWL